MDGEPKLPGRVREQIRIRHYSIRTETAYGNPEKDFPILVKYARSLARVFR